MIGSVVNSDERQDKEGRLLAKNSAVFGGIFAPERCSGNSSDGLKSSHFSLVILFEILFVQKCGKFALTLLPQRVSLQHAGWFSRDSAAGQKRAAACNGTRHMEEGVSHLESRRPRHCSIEDADGRASGRRMSILWSKMQQVLGPDQPETQAHQHSDAYSPAFRRRPNAITGYER